jgi:hypothetical protein
MRILSLFVLIALLTSLILPASAQKATRKTTKIPPPNKTQKSPPKSTPPKPVLPPNETDTFFGLNQVINIEIELDGDATNSLRNEPRKYIEGTFKEGGKVYQKVGIHLRGAAGSMRSIDDKPGLTFNMDKYVKNQRFYGMEKFHLTNSVQDPTYSTELLCGEIFRDAGIPASRFTHATVSINGKFKGLYCLKEGYDKQFLRKHFNDSKGNLYDGGFLRDLDQPLERLSGKEEYQDQRELRALADAAKDPKLDQRFSRLSQLLDMNRFITYLALEVMLWDWDGYPMNRNNYRIYHDPIKNKIIFIPSGMDQMFANVEGPILPGFQGLIARSLLETPEGKERYFTRMRQLLQSVIRVEARLKRLIGVEAKVKPVFTAISKEEGLQYGLLMESLRERVRARFREVEKQLSTIPVSDP